MNTAIARTTPFVLFMLVVSCGHHSAITVEHETKRDDQDRVVLKLEVGCYDTRGPDSLVDRLRGVDNCSNLTICWRVRWFDEAPPLHVRRMSELSTTWLEQHTVASDESCETTDWENWAGVVPRSYEIRPPSDVEPYVRGGTFSVEGEGLNVAEDGETFVVPSNEVWAQHHHGGRSESGANLLIPRDQR